MIKVKPILPVKFNVRAITNELEKFAESIADEIDKDYAKTYATWQNKPQFDKRVTRTSKSITAEVSTASKIYRYIDQGTDVRFVEMSADFRPKTRPNFIGSLPGRGNVRRFDRSNPQPGIVSRNFTTVLSEKYRKRIPRLARQALIQGVKASGHAYP